ncbi:LuxR C-terminal-related transcriptional regulator [Bacteroides acidifaciens]|nr:LuxR C-terminal-related transcriptional regulator [Bacteroides acidifaciens]
MAKEELMSYKQISEALDISERTVNTHMTNAIRKLTASL